MKRRLNLSLLAFALSFLTSLEAIAQEITMPEFYINDSNATAPAACVNQNVPNRSVIAEYNGPSGFFGPGTVFILELSDADGVFQDPPLELFRFTSATAVGASAELDFGPFPIPTDLRGENYSMRVRDADSQVIGLTENIPIYYFDTSQGVTLTGPNIEANNVALCQGDSVTLTALPDGFPAYIWTRDGNVIAGETGNTLENVSQPGNYNVKIDFGFCNAFFNFDSANTNVFIFNTANVFINEEAASPVEYCPEDVKLLTCSITDPAYTYEWFLDGEAIADSNTPFLTLPQSNFAGDYTVMVTASENCSVLTNSVEVINLGSDILTQPPPQLIILPSETITLAITTNAPAGSTIQWFENDTPIIGANGLSIDITTTGLYRADVLTNDVCMSTLQAETEVFSPVDFKPTVSQVIDCDDNIATLALEDLFGITAGGLEIPLTTNQYTFFDFEWFRDGTTTGETGLTFTVNGINENDSYTLTATFIAGGFPTDTSDPVMIEFLTDDITILSDPPFLPFGGTVTLSVPLSSLYTYEWFTDVSGDFQLIEGETTNMLVVSEEANYRVIITYQDCVVQREISVGDEPGASAVIPNVITPNGSPGVNDNWVLPDEFEASDVKVTIYSSNGKLDFEKSGGYNEDWPSNSASGASELIYYYIITRNSAVVKKGTITVMR
ncbi:T9SS type B sorting domain-containing protein [Aquimarina sp. 2201CG14-23]|uniref:T9SS type B sorting domain-containing protein n=1 Tax=Aquimarina mycalae TaxID=3040073 RepID=UPI002477EDC5|nr:gliding motility-associated C-terminal domain-containing protein [Aquimarina sp. 2201CG14-23]MDH7446329.1 gliding motility-associated C-terminal domain-containing protein [Aquimarina sp. 2201CG14-23]